MNDSNEVNILAPLWRRKWLILAVGIVVAAASYVYYKHQRHVYQSTMQVYLGAASEEQLPGEKVSKNKAVDASNQAAIINSIITERVRKGLRKQHKAALIRGGKVRAKSAEKSQFIDITTEARTAKGSALLANGVAQAYIKRQTGTHRHSIEKAISITRRQLHRVEAASVPKVPAKTSTEKTSTENAAGEKGEKGKEATTTTTAPSAPSTSTILQTANLNSKINQLEASLAVTGAQQIKVAKPANAVLLSPKPRKNAIFGFVIGLVLAAIAAYVLGRLDRRLRSLAGVERNFHSQILAGLPKVKRPVVRREGRPSPSRFLLEPMRRLHTALALGGGGAHGANGQSAQVQGRHGPGRVLLFTSADAGDGKSTVVADLALVQREAGERVAVLEANFRRPIQGKLLGVDGTRGLAEVLAHGLAADELMQRVSPIPGPGAVQPAEGGGVATAVESQTAGSLFVLASGGGVPNPPAALGNGGIRELLHSLAQDFDYVLIDAPSPLDVSDAMPLMSLVDGIVVVARIGHTREMAAQRLQQLLAQPSNAPVLGVVANCVPRRDAVSYGFQTPGLRLLGR
ncbi:MAG TPA: Wzz/FepE/Etk N-terminal domain-containing protein [Solirubrobacteraceae bacterium]|jgi:Mrp family chromosome partitioning ATPase|nr:Wzz/FepE/Etk N-terminal domain-containing protein [Solirubrobacteraceae bacterium]